MPSGEPNISGDWAPEQLVMTDPRGRGGDMLAAADVPYSPDECNELTFVDYSNEGQSQSAQPEAPAAVKP